MFNLLMAVMSKSVVMIMNTLVIWERYLGSRTNGPHRPPCARNGLGKCGQVEAAWACFSATWCEPSGQCSAAAGLLPAVACLHSSTFVTVSPPSHWEADPQGPWTASTPGEAQPEERVVANELNLEPFPDVLQSIRLRRTSSCSLLSSPHPSLFQSPSVSVFGSFLTPG